MGRTPENLSERTQGILRIGVIGSEGFDLMCGAISVTRGDNLGYQGALLGIVMDTVLLAGPLLIMEDSVKSPTLASRISRGVNLAEVGVAMAGSMLAKIGVISGNNDLAFIGAITEVVAGTTAALHAYAHEGIKRLQISKPTFENPPLGVE